MTQVIAKPGENIESLIRRFNKAVEKDKILSDYKKHQVYEKPSAKKRREKVANIKRTKKRLEKLDRVSKFNPNNKNFKWNRDQTKKINTLPPEKKYKNKKPKNRGNRK